MTLIDSNLSHSLAFSVGTLLFALIVGWAIWIAANMD